MYKVIYQKSNGVVFERIRNSIPEYGIGHKTSMGWKILDVLYNFNGQYYCLHDYKALLNKERKKRDKIRKLKNLLKLRIRVEIK